MNIYVGNLAYSVTEADLKAAFAPFGEVVSAELIINRHTRRSRGYGFVRMATAEQGRAAIAALDGTEFHGREMRVDESRPDTDKPSRTEQPRRSGRRPSSTPRHASRQESKSTPRKGGLLGLLKSLFGRS
ncbi:MAG: RNA recognition motif domain-containing protein [Chromatiales bacterium]